MAKDDVKKKITGIIVDALGNNFQGIENKKIYAALPDNGELVQVAISLTCPKTQIEFGNAFDTASPNAESTVVPLVEDYSISQEEKEKVVDIMSKLGL